MRWMLLSLPIVMSTGAFGGGPVFTDVAVERGISYVTTQGNIQIESFGVGLAFVDLDNDGDHDFIAVGADDGTVGIWENDGQGFFTDRSDTAGLAPVLGASGVIAGDYDNDGDLDLYFSRWLMPNNLYRNDGGFQFTDVSAAAGVDDPGAGSGPAWGDFDNDGWLDLYVSNRTGSQGDLSLIPNRLYHNQGDGTFVDVAQQLDVDAENLPTFGAVFFDMDRDGDSDLYLSTDRGHQFPQNRNRLFENVGGSFVEITDSSGTAANINSMGVGVGDFDRNGLLDLYATNTAQGNKLFLNQGDGVFEDASVAAGVTSNFVGWGATFVDLDLDGWEELFSVNADTSNRVYDHNGTFPCVDLAAEYGIEETKAINFCLAWADIDLDGDIDLATQSLNGQVRLWLNQLVSDDHYLSLRILSETTNRFAIGALAEVTADGISQIKQVAAGSNYKSQNQLPLHYGLGASEVADTIIVTWPGAQEQRTLTNYPADARWTIMPADMLGDGNLDGQVNSVDFAMFMDCYQSDAFAPGCEMMDLDGDADVDLDDFGEFLPRYSGNNGDCDGDGMSNLMSILTGNATDANEDGVPDGCQATGDLDGNGSVGGLDLLLLLNSWGRCGGCPADLTGDGAVTGQDLLQLLNNWG